MLKMLNHCRRFMAVAGLAGLALSGLAAEVLEPSPRELIPLPTWGFAEDVTVPAGRVSQAHAVLFIDAAAQGA